jgi:TPR repeat protein
MIESGFDDRPADPEAALEYYKKAAKNGCLDALINQAAYHLNSVDGDKNLGRLLLLQAYKGGNQRAADYMIHFEIFKNKKEIEAASVNFDEEYLSQMAQSSMGFNLLTNPNNKSLRNNLEVIQGENNTKGNAS